MKKNLIVIIISCLLFATSCNLPDFTSGEKSAEKTNTAFIKALNAQDKNGIKALLCEYTLEEEDIDKQIEEMFEFFDDSVFPIKKDNIVMNSLASEETSWTDGVETMKIIAILKIQSESNKCYTVYCTAWPVCSDQKKQGVVGIDVVNTTGLDINRNRKEYMRERDDPNRHFLLGRE